MKSDVDSSEVEKLLTIAVRTRNEQEKLQSYVGGIKTELVTAFEERSIYEQMLEQIRNWLRTKSEAVVCPSIVPLKSVYAEKVLEKYKNLDNEIKQYSENNITGLKRQGAAFFKDCSEEDKDVLQSIQSDVDDKFNSIQHTLSGTINCLSNLLEARKDFEKEVDIAQKWLYKAEIAIQADVKNLNTPEGFKEQLKNLESLEDEREEANKRVTSIANMCADLLPYLNETDKFALGELVRDLQDKTDRVNANISDKTDFVRDAVEIQQKNMEKMSIHHEQLATIQKEIKALSRPVGRTVEDGQKLLSSYQEILKKVNELRKGLGEVQRSGDLNINDIRDVIKQQQDIIITLEKQITRIRQLILVRQQYASLVTEITGFIKRYPTVIKDIEQEEKTVTDKIKKYGEAISRIQEYEAHLTTAQDKGSIIGEEGTVEDRNAIMEQLQNLKTSLTGLRREIEKRQQEHESSAESHKRLKVELNTAMEWLTEQESELMSRPLLTLEIESAEEELESHEELSSDINAQLQKIKEIIEKSKKETGLPYMLVERISEAKLVLSTYPLELESRLKYLKDAKMLREDYKEFSSKIKRWISNAQKTDTEENVDYENIRSELEEHLAFFSSQTLIGESLQQLSQTSERIVPSLAAEDQEHLTKDLQELTKGLDEVSSAARDRRSALEKNVQLVVDYKKKLEAAQELINKARAKIGQTSKGTSIAALRNNLQRIDEERSKLYGQNTTIQNYSDKANELLQRAVKASQIRIGNELICVTKDWKSVLEEVDVQRECIRAMISKWQDYDVAVRTLTAGLYGIEQRCQEIDDGLSPSEDMEDTKEILEVSTIEFSDNENQYLVESAANQETLSGIPTPSSITCRKRRLSSNRRL